MTTNNNFSYFLLGAGLGAGCALLFAPQSGAGARNYLRTKALEGSDTVKRRGAELCNTATDAIERGKQDLREKVNTLAKAVESGKQAYQASLGARG